MDYYIMYNGQQIGPMPKEQLVNYGLTPQTMVWAQGMQNWVHAGSVPDLADVLNAVPPMPSTPPSPGPGQSNFPQAPVRNLQSQAIIATVLSFLFSCIGTIFGIIAITKAGRANTLAAAGQTAEARECNNTAHTMIVLAYVFAGAGFVTWLIVLLSAWS